MDIEQRIAKRIAWRERCLDVDWEEIKFDAARVAIRAMKAAPHDIHKLKMEIAIKTKQIIECTTRPEKTIMQAELEGLIQVRDIVTIENESPDDTQAIVRKHGS